MPFAINVPRRAIFLRTPGSIQIVQSSPVMEDAYEFLGAIETESPSSNRSWTVPLLLNGISFSFRIDTGADVTVIPESVATQEYCVAT